MEKMQGAEFYISKRVGRAMVDYRMLAEGDKIAVAVSGGKDSLSLLKVLLERRSFVPLKYELLALHIDTGYPKSFAARLKRYFRKLKVEYHIEKIDTLKNTPKDKISCFWCSWNRRKALFESAYRLGYTKIALGHHMDDIIETVLLNMFFQGEVSAMSCVQKLFGGKITLIRPLAYVEEYMIKRFVKEQAIPYDSCLCPNSAISNRSKMGEIIADLKKVCPDIKKNIFRSVKRVKTDYLL